ncbi:MAG TPA: hypothetical protein VGQ90_05845 [Stellaceae bacterium]|jgi:hypothetical protein|nr:hypothetical protein [Stellaceae bacterium]
MPKAYLAVRAEVPEADRERFEHWYATDHLPWAARVFQARRAWRCWSRSDPGLHIAFYEFDSVADAEATQSAEATKALVADFDRVWAGRVPRRREILEFVQEIAP